MESSSRLTHEWFRYSELEYYQIWRCRYCGSMVVRTNIESEPTPELLASLITDPGRVTPGSILSRMICSEIQIEEVMLQ